MVRSKKPVSKTKQIKNSELQAAFKTYIASNESQDLQKLDKMLETQLEQLEAKYTKLKMAVPVGLLRRTYEEIVNGLVPDSDLTNTVLSSTVLTEITMNKTVGKKTLKRSSSCDDGYTSESTRATNSGERASRRQSRARVKTTATKNSSRSLTRTRGIQNSHVTPVNKQLPRTNLGTITPKVKTNTPLLCMRRPKIGEMAWSNQGSPLLVNACAAPDQAANVNIPIRDDGVLSILPQRGDLRRSQIPEFDSQTRKQLEILRDNLIKLCNPHD